MIFTVVMGVISFSCGIKGPPLPPLEKNETVQTQKANVTPAPATSASGDKTQKKKTQ